VWLPKAFIHVHGLETEFLAFLSRGNRDGGDGSDFGNSEFDESAPGAIYNSDVDNISDLENI
jgi:hypothetical protein